MNRWFKIIFALSLISAAALTAAWQHYVNAPKTTQAELAQLIKEAKPLLKRQQSAPRAEIAASISTLLDTPQVGETAEKKSERLAAKAKIDAAVEALPSPAASDDFTNYKSRLGDLESRFAALNQAHLTACQSEASYQKWGALRLRQDWAQKRVNFDTPPDEAIAAYEASAAKYTGRTARFSEIKAAGETEYAAVQTQLKTLAEQVENTFGQDLDSFAARPENFSTSEPDIIKRLAPLLAAVEAEFVASGDFDFAPVPKGKILTRQGYGPNFAIASYRKPDNAMVIYYADGRYNHIYDTMLAVHEIIPGHHLHLKMEKQRLCGQGPVASRTSFTEGWATYTELLADERGLFGAPDQRLGWLDYRLMRAMRIILDTARIEKGLSEAQAWALWQEKMPPRLDDDFPREWARIKNSPHHLSYIFGSLAIMEARERLRAELGEEFNEADFHRAILNAPHSNLMFLTERARTQMRARALQNAGNVSPGETTL